MKFLSLKPFIPSGPDMERSKELFQALGFTKTWDMGDYAGFEKDGCAFILQQYDNQAFAENLMLSVGVDDVAAFRRQALDNQLPQRFGIRIGMVTQQPYGKEVNVIDIAGVCWHFVEP
ncbi:MAG TPA: hypothetical protein PKC69_02220 [Chitinophagaceae bacterium]|nr:hypothetical protein [Chitinophagaceae bacterium]